MHRYELMARAWETRAKALAEANAELTNKISRLEKLYRAGTFYLRMQNAIMEDENIAMAWREFYTILCLAHPNIEHINAEP
jgi:hypothetical protein